MLRLLTAHRSPFAALLGATVLAGNVLAGNVLAGNVLAATEPVAPAEVQSDSAPREASVHRVDRGEGAQALLVPVGETLRYVATLRTALGDIRVGTVDLSSGVDPYRRSLLASATNRAQNDTAWVNARAYGDYTLYVMDARLETRFQGLEWPYSVHKYNHEGTEKRRRELLTGRKDGEWISAYRGDTSHGAPEGLRIWGDVREQTVPMGAVDSLSAVYLVRSAVAEGKRGLHFAMLDKHRIWDVRVTLGEPTDVETPAGTFRARRVELVTERVDQEALEERAREAEDGDTGEFSGPFGIKGNIELWLEERTGIPLVIKGELPVILGDFAIDMRLESSSGTPAGFAPAESDSGQ